MCDVSAGDCDDGFPDPPFFQLCPTGCCLPPESIKLLKIESKHGGLGLGLGLTVARMMHCTPSEDCRKSFDHWGVPNIFLTHPCWGLFGGACLNARYCASWWVMRLSVWSLFFDGALGKDDFLVLCVLYFTTEHFKSNFVDEHAASIDSLGKRN